MDLETMNYYDCEMIKSERDRVKMYIGYGWYEYAKGKNLKVGDTLLYHYYSNSEMLCINLLRRAGKNNA